MVVCKFYQQGYCKFGNSCRFEHIRGGQSNYGGNYYNSYGQRYEKQAFTPNQNYGSNNRFNTLADNYRGDNRTPKSANVPSAGRQETFDEFVVITLKEVESVVKQKLWPFSAFGLARTGGTLLNYPGLQDVSPEELRWEAYQSQQQGTMNNFIHGVEQLFRSQQAIREEIRNRSTSVMDILKKVYLNQPLPAYQSGQTNVFGQVTGSGSPSSFNFSLSHLNQSSNQTPFFSNNSGVGLASPMNDTSHANFTWPSSAAAVPQTSFGQTGMTQGTSGFGSEADNRTFTSAVFEPTHPTNTSAPFREAAPAFSNINNNNAVNNNNAFNVETTAVDKAVIDAYTPMDRLTTEERQQYEASAFSLGMVPVRPPPKELCF